MNVLFLDFDGVINVPGVMEGKDEKPIIAYYFPSDGKVNQTLALKFVEHFCVNYDYKIVISSSWRRFENCEEVLRNSGLSDSVEIIGKTPIDIKYINRGENIEDWLKEHDGVEKFIILDDMGPEYFPGLEDHLIQTPELTGFMLDEYDKAVKYHFGMDKKRENVEHDHE